MTRRQKLEQQTLADQTLAEMANTHTNPPKWVDPALRNDLLLARRFVLDTNASAFLADLTLANFRTRKRGPHVELRPDEATERATEFTRVLARLPHKTCWIEYDCKAYDNRQLELIGFGGQEGIARIGWLLRQHDKIETAFRASIMIGYADHGVNQQVLDLIWTTDETMLPWKMTVVGVGEIGDPQTSPFMNRFMCGLGRRINGHAGPTRNGMTQYLGKNLSETEPSPEDVMLTAGMELRRILTLLATINDIPVGVKQVTPSHGYMAKGQYRKFLTHSIVTLNLPKGRDPHKVARAIIAISRKRAHQVRGHWRRDWRHEGSRIWVKEHQRGDASLGFVTHDYKVEHEPTAV